MKFIDFEKLFEEAARLEREGIKWHFHMLGRECIFNETGSGYLIVLEGGAGREIPAARFEERPLVETKKMAELAYGPGFLAGPEPEGLSTSGHPAMEKIMARARHCVQTGKPWHNHHLPPDCKFNPYPGRHCLVFEEETEGEALYAEYDHDPVADLAALESLLFKDHK
ncbi:MAG: hypothetical protein AB1896_03430 [Thermodesulfobacteriota bacterium]